jgi:TM2 domain-containing membrane protein YozV
MTAASHGYKSKTIATWIALIGGSLGLHRFYLHGLRDGWGWLFVLPTFVGVYGVQRMRLLGGDDQLAWALIPFLGLTLATAMVTAIVLGLTPDDRWNARFNPSGPQHSTGWATVIGVAAALFIGAGVLMATIAFSAQRYFEYQAAHTPQSQR